MSNWFILCIIFIIATSSAKLIQKVALRNSDIYPASFMAYFQLIAGITSIPFSGFKFEDIHANSSTWIAVLIISLTYAGGGVLYARLLKIEEISQLEILSTTRSIWFLVLGIVFYNEAFTVHKFVGIILIVGGLGVIYWRNGGLKAFGKPQILMMFYAFIMSASTALDKFILNSLSVGVYQVLAYILPAILTMIFIPASIKNMGPLFKLNKSNLQVVASAVLHTIAAFSVFTVYKFGGELSKVGPITQTSTVLTVLLGILLLGERQNALRKIIGAAIVVVGVVFIKVM